MKLIGLTGGVGMGKSTAAGFLLQRGVRLTDTDEVARALVRPGEPALAEIRSAFGPGVFAAEGGLDRAALAAVVFADGAARQRLEAILHPRIRAHWQAQVAGWRSEGAPTVVVVIPLLYETQAEEAFDEVVCVACGPVSQRERLAARGWTGAQIEQRIAAQWPVEQKLARARAVVWTEGTPAVHERQVERLLARWR